jgi:hypothetical protein
LEDLKNIWGDISLGTGVIGIRIVTSDESSCDFGKETSDCIKGGEFDKTESGFSNCFLSNEPVTSLPGRIVGIVSISKIISPPLHISTRFTNKIANITAVSTVANRTKVC